jgi:hypothetical protein
LALPSEVEAVGTLEPQGRSRTLYGRYSLQGENGQPLFALASDAVSLEAVIGRQVRVRGPLVPGYPFASGPPYLYVTQVQVIDERRRRLA